MHHVTIRRVNNSPGNVFKKVRKIKRESARERERDWGGGGRRITRKRRKSKQKTSANNK